MITWLSMQNDSGLWEVGYYIDREWFEEDTFETEQEASNIARKRNREHHDKLTVREKIRKLLHG
jgi:hypothetical protein